MSPCVGKPAAAAAVAHVLINVRKWTALVHIWRVLHHTAHLESRRVGASASNQAVRGYGEPSEPASDGSS